MKSHIKILLALLVSLGFSSCTFIPAGGAYGGGYQQPPRPIVPQHVRDQQMREIREVDRRVYAGDSIGPWAQPTRRQQPQYDYQPRNYVIQPNSYGNSSSGYSVGVVPPGQNSIGYDQWKQRWAR